jgi:hypothetical protein
MKLRDLYREPFVAMSQPEGREPIQIPAPGESETAGGNSIAKPRPAAHKPVLTKGLEFEEAEKIVTAWRDIMGVTLSVDLVRAHLDTLKRWHDKLKAGRGRGEK